MGKREIDQLRAQAERANRAIVAELRQSAGWQTLALDNGGLNQGDKPEGEDNGD